MSAPAAPTPSTARPRLPDSYEIVHGQMIDLDAPKPPPLPEHYELIHDRPVELPPMSFQASNVANLLNGAPVLHLASTRTGRTWVENMFRIPVSDDRRRGRKPDLAYVSFDRLPPSRRIPYRGDILDVVPDLVAEVVSPGDGADAVVAKAREYLRGGVRVVWVVYPLAREAHAYRPNGRTLDVYAAGDHLDCPDVLPGFSAAVADLIPAMTDLPADALPPDDAADPPAADPGPTA